MFAVSLIHSGLQHSESSLDILLKISMPTDFKDLIVMFYIFIKNLHAGLVIK